MGGMAVELGKCFPPQYYTTVFRHCLGGSRGGGGGNLRGITRRGWVHEKSIFFRQIRSQPANNHCHGGAHISDLILLNFCPSK